MKKEIVVMGLSAVFGLKLAADAAYARGDVAEGNRLMREYTNAIVRAEKEKIQRKMEIAEAQKKRIERERKETEAKQKRIEENKIAEAKKKKMEEERKIAEAKKKKLEEARKKVK